MNSRYNHATVDWHTVQTNKTQLYIDSILLQLYNFLPIEFLNSNKEYIGD